MPNPENTAPAMEHTETTEQEPQQKNLLSPETAADQTLWLIGINPLRNEIPLSEYNIKRKIDGRKIINLKKEHSEKITQASLNECNNYWNEKNVTNPMNEWINSTQSFIDNYADDESKTNFLKKLINTENKNLEEVELSPLAIYNTFIKGPGQRKPEYYAERVVTATQNKTEEFQTNKEIIEDLSKIYGEEFGSKIALTLAYAKVNAQNNSKELSAATRKQLLEKQYDTTLWEKLEANANEWKAKQNQQSKEESVTPTRIFESTTSSQSIAGQQETQHPQPTPFFNQNSEAPDTDEDEDDDDIVLPAP